MKINDNQFRWVYEHIEELQKLLTMMDYCKDTKTFGEFYETLHQRYEDLTFSMFLISLGYSIPKYIWSCNDYCDLCSLLDDNKDSLEIED